MKNTDKIYPIKSKDKYLHFRRILEVMGVLSPISLLSNAERNLLAKLMVLRSNYSTLDEDEIPVVMLSPKNKKEIMEEFKMTGRQVLDNALSTLRRKGALLKDNKLPDFLIIDEDATLNINFKFDLITK